MSVPDVIKMIMSRWVRWAGHVAVIGERKGFHIGSLQQKIGKKETTRKT
jgi:hypothetical protein